MTSDLSRKLEIYLEGKGSRIKWIERELREGLGSLIGILSEVTGELREEVILSSLYEIKRGKIYSCASGSGRKASSVEDLVQEIMSGNMDLLLDLEAKKDELRPRYGNMMLEKVQEIERRLRAVGYEVNVTIEKDRSHRFGWG